MSTPDLTDLTDYLHYWQTHAQRVVREHVDKIRATVDGGCGGTTIIAVSVTDTLFEAAAWLNAIDLIQRRRGATLSEVRDFVDDQLRNSSCALANSPSPASNLARIHQVMVWSALLSQFTREGWGAQPQ